MDIPGWDLIPIRADSPELPDALELVWRVFEQFEAPGYAPEGIEEFKAFIWPEAIRENFAGGRFWMWGCLQDDRVLGVIAARLPAHVNLLFVDPEYHRQGIARALFDRLLIHLLTTSRDTALTVNASPYAVEVYKRFGFEHTGPEQTVNGIRFFPMQRPLP